MDIAIRSRITTILFFFKSYRSWIAKLGFWLLTGKKLVSPTAFWPITREPKPCLIWDWWWNINNNITFHFRLFPGKTDVKIFQKIQENRFWGHFGPFSSTFGQKLIFLEKGLSVFKYSNFLSLCKKSEKTNDPFLRKMPNWQTNWHRQTGRQTARQTGRKRWLYRTLRKMGVQNYEWNKEHLFLKAVSESI